MKAALALLANPSLYHTAADITLDAHRVSGLGFEVNRLPYHVSLKQTFKINHLPQLEQFCRRYARTLSPVMASFKKLTLWPSSVFGYQSGVLVVEAEKSEVLAAMHNGLNQALEKAFGSSPADFDGDAYTFHMTVAIGGKPYECYERAYAQLSSDKSRYLFQAEFKEIGLFYYDSDQITPGSYFCYRRYKIGA